MPGGGVLSPRPLISSQSGTGFESGGALDTCAPDGVLAGLADAVTRDGRLAELADDETSDAVKESSCLENFLGGVGEGGGFVVVLAGVQAVVEAAEEPAEEVALGGGVPVAGLAAPVVVGAGAG